MPCGARVYCQLIQMDRVGHMQLTPADKSTRGPANQGSGDASHAPGERVTVGAVGAVASCDASAANAWHWRPDYEGVELGHRRYGLCRVFGCAYAAGGEWLSTGR